MRLSILSSSFSSRSHFDSNAPNLIDTPVSCERPYKQSIKIMHLSALFSLFCLIFFALGGPLEARHPDVILPPIVASPPPPGHPGGEVADGHPGGEDTDSTVQGVIFSVNATNFS
jgi:hypothetical protein